MSDPNKLLPPPAPPLPPRRIPSARPGVLQRLVAPLGFGAGGSRPPSEQAHGRAGSGHRPDPVRIQSFGSPPSQTATHKTGIPIAALDISPTKNFAVLAGKEILKTVRITENKVTEEFNLRSAITAFASTQTAQNGEARATRRRDFLPANDVKWSHGQYDSTIATAANNGRVALYDLRRPEVEQAWLHEHTRSVHKLGFDPHKGYLLLSGSHDSTVKMWDLRTLAGERADMKMKSSRLFQGRAEAVRDLRWSPTDAFEFVMCTDAGVIQCWDIRSPAAPKLRLTGHEKACFSLDWHPDGRHVVSAGLDKYVRVWDFHRDDRRQKPCFCLKAPQAVRNIRWRPPCWSSELHSTGHWQSTQLATSYAPDDPRIHIWDLRRPYIPFRELDRYHGPATDLLWCTKDLLWTVGEEGMFTQNDMTFANQVYQELSPCALEWFPNGEYTVFAENRDARCSSSLEDVAVGFLSVSQEKLSSGEQAVISRSFSDDEADGDGSLSLRRRQSKATSTRSVKSRASSPPPKDDPVSVLPLGKAVFERKDLFNNKQIGFIAEMSGAAIDPDILRHITGSYATPATEKQRNSDPAQILQKLEEAFRINADTGDSVAMYRLGQSWRILSAVIIPELRAWAEENRQMRLARSRLQTAKGSVSTMEPDNLSQNLSWDESPFPKRYSDDSKLRQSARRDFPHGFDFHKRRPPSELESTSNVTTPVAKPLPDSPLSDRLQNVPDYQNLNEPIETITPLPPSVLASHSTAETASNALQDDVDQGSGTPPSSPETRRSLESPHKAHRRNHTIDSPSSSSSSLLQLTKTAPQPIHGRSPGWRPIYTPTRPPQRDEEEKRAALRDYVVQSRPVLKFDDALKQNSHAPFLDKVYRHDSNESFPMFSASTDGSQKAKSLGQSFDSPEKIGKTLSTPEDWTDRQRSFEPSSPPSDESAAQSKLSHIFGVGMRGRRGGSRASVVGQDGMDGGSPGSGSASPTQFEMDGTQANIGSGLATSSSPNEPFHFEHSRRRRAKTAPHRHLREVRDSSFRPQLVPEQASTATAQRPAPELPTPTSEPAFRADSPNFIRTDFRPPPAPSTKHLPPWSSLPLIAHAIAFDLQSGTACAHFSAHLLMHIYPYFFHPLHLQTLAPCIPESKVQTQLTAVAQKLMDPRTSQRIIEGILVAHFAFLKRMRMFVPMAELRNLAAEFGFGNDFGFSTGAVGEGQNTVAALSGTDPYFVSVVCARCRAPMVGTGGFCERCNSVREVCPICMRKKFVGEEGRWKMIEEGKSEQREKAMWTYCHWCGHSAHLGCMEMWLGQEFAGGYCPTRGCGCDCAPGEARNQRIERQVREAEEGRLVIGSGGGSPARVKVKEGGRKVGESKAVERVGRVLRGAERETQSGDERRVIRGRGGAGGRDGRDRENFGAGGGRKTVRVLTPGEETT